MVFIRNNPLNYPPNTTDSIRRYMDDRAPTITDFKQFIVGDEWLDTSSNDWWKLCYRDTTQGIWRKMAGTAAATELFTPDAGGQIGPDALNNINLLGGAGITTTGNPGTNTITIALTGGSAAIDTITSNAGGAVSPDGVGNLNLVGTATNGINITGNPGAFTQTVSLQSPYADGDFEFRNTAAATPRNVTINNTNANAASDSYLAITVPAASADPFVKFTVAAATAYSWGIDNSDSDSLKLTDSTTPSLGNTLWKMTVFGERTLPLQPSFLAYLASGDNNVTGNGGIYTIGTVTALTEVFDQNSDFNVNGTFTAPVTGRYHLNSHITYGGTTNATAGQIGLVTSNRTYNAITRSPAGANGCPIISEICDMDAADTATVNLVVSGEAADSDDVVGAANLFSSFSGCLEC